MKFMKKVIDEVRIVLSLTSYFAIVFILLMIMKKLYLEDYNIEFSGLSQAIIGALILAKVVLLMELIRPAAWVRKQPPIVNVIIRTLLYTLGVAIVMILEKSFEKRHEAGSFGDAIKYIVSHRDFYHVWATTIGVSGSLFAYNAFSILQHMLGKKGMMKLFFHTSLDQVEHATLTEKNLSFGLK